MKPELHILIAGGGTGGHLFPGIAIAEAFLSENPSSRILFVGTGRSFETTTLARLGFAHAVIPAGGLKGLGPVQRFRSLVKLPLGMCTALRIIRSFQPHLVIGVGGYSSGPVALAARLAGVPVAIHEQNRLPGITNRVLARLAQRVYVSFPPEPGDRGKPLAGPEKLRWTGNPVRQSLLDAGMIHRNRNTSFTVLILGGSQGARGINRAVTAALPHLANPEQFCFIHQTGPKDTGFVADAYTRAGIAADVRPFFDDVARQYHRADLILCRAGATTVAEVTALGKPAVFVPFPYAADDHQTYNAEIPVRAGAAEMIPEAELTGERLARLFSAYAARPEKRRQMAARARTLGRPDAASRIVADCCDFLEDRIQRSPSVNQNRRMD